MKFSAKQLLASGIGISLIAFAGYRGLESSPLEGSLRLISHWSTRPGSPPVSQSPSASAGVSVDGRKLDDEIKQAIIDLAQVAAAAHLDPRELQSGALSLPEDEFLAKLPETVRPGYEHLLGLIHQAQDRQLQVDGRDRSFFEEASRRNQAPAFLKRHLAKLDAVVLNPDVRDYVERLGREDSLSDPQLTELVDLCGRERSCVEKSAVILVRDRHHNLSEDQIVLIGRNL